MTVRPGRRARCEEHRLHPRASVLFQGDSITDAVRDRTRPADLGHGYAALAAAGLPGAPVVLDHGRRPPHRPARALADRHPWPTDPRWSPS
ncbi:hypothetical protein [Kitasatospora sp. CMC57]|uniref:hypothetical protein n=1 Tax=Kitasatospora sp. CMC57 TaxID=3231513 RepID=UPI0038B6285F